MSENSRPQVGDFLAHTVYLLLQKPTLDKEQLSNYRPISNLSVIFKIIERVVKSRFTDHLVSNGHLNPHQSAYCKHHSTETALLYMIMIVIWNSELLELKEDWMGSDW